MAGMALVSNFHFLYQIQQTKVFLWLVKVGVASKSRRCLELVRVLGVSAIVVYEILLALGR